MIYPDHITPTRLHIYMYVFSFTVPVLSFTTAKHTVNEEQSKLSVSIVRTGDLSCTVSVICYTRQQSAAVRDDYQELVSFEEVQYWQDGQ